MLGKECCGKNVEFAPMNITKKFIIIIIFYHLGFIDRPVNINEQEIPSKTPNKARTGKL